MANDNYNSIVPVESLQNIAGLTPIQKNKDEKQNQRQNQKKKQQTNKHDELIPTPQKNPNMSPDISGDDDHSIDYCA